MGAALTASPQLAGRAGSDVRRSAGVTDSAPSRNNAMTADSATAGRAWADSSATAVSPGTGACLGSGLGTLDAYVSVLTCPSLRCPYRIVL